MPKKVTGIGLRSIFHYYLSQVRGRAASFILQWLLKRLQLKTRGLMAGLGLTRYAGKGISEVDLVLLPEDFHSGASNQVLGVARQLVEGKLTVLGATANEFGPGIDWARDFRSGAAWRTKFHSKYSYLELLDFPHGSDVKIPWELARLQFLPRLAYAYYLSGEVAYRRFLVELLTAWDEKNPVGWGIGWATGMEASLRAVSIIWAATILKRCGCKDALDQNLLGRILVEHGRFIYRNVESSDINGNHHTACLLGLFYLATSLSQYKEAPAWLTLAKEGIQSGVILQTYPDGVCHEGSIPYHRLVTEMFLHAALVAKNNSIDLGDEFGQRLRKMLRFVRGYLKPNGQAPIFGDADDGRVLSVGSQGMNDHRYLLAAGSALCGSIGCNSLTESWWDDAILLVGQGALAETEKTNVGSRLESESFPEGGFFFLKNKEDYVAVDCGDVGMRGRGGHGHNDALSVEIVLNGVDVVTDSGCPTYTASRDWRLKALSALSHNVAVVDGREPAQIREVGIPTATACPTRVLLWRDEMDAVKFKGEHYGYLETLSVTYRRLVALQKNVSQVIIEDSFTGHGVHRVDWYFHLSPEAEVVDIAEGAALIRIQHKEFVLKVGEVECFLSTKSSHYSPSYGVRMERPMIQFSCETLFPLTATFQLTVSK